MSADLCFIYAFLTLIKHIKSFAILYENLRIVIFLVLLTKLRFYILYCINIANNNQKNTNKISYKENNGRIPRFFLSCHMYHSGVEYEPHSFGFLRSINIIYQNSCTPPCGCSLSFFFKNPCHNF